MNMIEGNGAATSGFNKNAQRTIKSGKLFYSLYLACILKINTT